MAQAKGTFEVKVAPLPPDGGAQDAALGRMSLDKQFHGDLEATGKGTDADRRRTQRFRRLCGH